MEREKALEKIRKCLNLSKSMNEHEAATALRQATKLMQEFDVNPLEASAPRIDKLTIETATAQGFPWESCLAGVIGKSLGLRVYVTKWNSSVTFYGNADRMKVAEYAYDALRGAIREARKQYVKSLSGRGMARTEVNRLRKAYAIGFAYAVGNQVTALVETPEEAFAIDSWKAKNSLTIRKTGRRVNVDSRGYAEGASAGQKHGLHRPIQTTTVAGYLK
jgi:hypothetical protein